MLVLFASLLTSAAHAADAASLAQAQALPSMSASVERFAAPTGRLGSRLRARAASDRTLGHQVLLWVPNRCLDAFDPFRARVRVGPGVGLSLRATEAVDLNVGAYFSVYAGLPGPRNRPTPKLPLGLEVMAGAEVSFLDAAPEFWVFTPDYGPAEFGVGVHALLVGADVGFDPREFVDFFGGIVLWDPVHDDL